MSYIYGQHSFLTLKNLVTVLTIAPFYQPNDSQFEYQSCAPFGPFQQTVTQICWSIQAIGPILIINVAFYNVNC